MEEKEQKLIIQGVLEENNFKINESEDLNTFFKAFKNESLTRLSLLRVWVDEVYSDLYKIQNLNNRPKKYIIEYINANLKEIVETHVKTMNKTTYEELKQIVNKGGNLKYKFGSIAISLHLIMYLKDYALGKVNYDKKNNMVHIFIPKEINDILKNAFKSKEIIKYNSEFNDICDYVINVLEAYGIVPITKLHSLFVRDMFDIDIMELNHIIGAKAMVDEIFNTYAYQNDMLVCQIDFADEDEAIDFYEDMKGKYYPFTKKEFSLFKDDKYIETLSSYKTFIKYILDNYEIDKSGLEDIKLYVVMEYIIMSQTCKKLALNNFIKSINTFFELNKKGEKEMIKLVNAIFDEYPKWHKKGNK